MSKKRDANLSFENPVGYAWLPLLNKGKINIDEQTLAVAATLPSGYLAIQPLGLGKGVKKLFTFIEKKIYKSPFLKICQQKKKLTNFPK